MKLNKKGWGTVEMLLLSGGLLIALIIAIYFIGKLYGSFDNAVSKKSYIDIENKLENAARKYVLFNNITLYDTNKLSYNTLKNAGYIDNLMDENGNSCNGYVLIETVDNIDHYTAYISCPDYQTKNY